MAYWKMLFGNQKNMRRRLPVYFVAFRKWKMVAVNLTLQDIYDFFKPAAQTCTWSNGDVVLVSWEHTPGTMRWFLRDGAVVPRGQSV